MSKMYKKKYMFFYVNKKRTVLAEAWKEFHLYCARNYIILRPDSYPEVTLEYSYIAKEAGITTRSFILYFNPSIPAKRKSSRDKIK